ncbi:MAG TPA: DUF2330 domain-containing protein [Candidatus Limnocylindria bacterium]|nr:DUF2330 domain-containing protein [Candidatus Limnocylindria bacterium]
MRRFILGATAIVAALLVSTQPAAACAGLIGPNGAVNLLRTTTFAGYHDGIEHYVTAFKFQGGSGQFGSLVPLPGVPTKVEKGGDWTLQRLIRETEFAKRLRAPLAFATAEGAASKDAEVLMQVKIDALDVTVLKGGGEAVGRWATEHGFRLPPDAPEVLDFYAARSPIFMAAIFDADAAKAKGQQIGDGTPVHITIPTNNPWVPLRILGTGKTGDERIEADVYLLTDRKPTLLPAPFANGMELEHSATASASLLDDLRSDKGMEWVPEMAWLTKIGINASAKQLTYDLAVSANGTVPSRVAAGLEAPATNNTSGTPTDRSNENLVLAGLAIAGLGALLLIARFAPRNVKP